MSDTILLLSDVDKIRERPGTYIGDDDKVGLFTIIREIIDNAIDEYPNYSDPSKPIIVTYHKDKSFTVRDYGRGISPYESKKNPGEIEERLAYTRMGAGGKFKANREANANRFSGGLNGIGACATNAMSEFFDVTIYKDGYKFHDRFEYAEPVIDLVDGQLPKTKLKALETGTQVHFKPTLKYLRTVNPDIDELEFYFEQQAYLHPNMALVFINERSGYEKVYHSENGLIDYMNKLTKDDKLMNAPFMIHGESEDNIKGFHVYMEATLAVAFSNDGSTSSECFTNGIYNSQGGTHLTGFRNGLVTAIRGYYKTFESEYTTQHKAKIALIKKVLKPDSVEKLFSPQTVMNRTHVIIDFKHNDPILQPQTKDKLVSDEAVKAVSQITQTHIGRYLDKNIRIVHSLIASLIDEVYEKAKATDENATLSKKDIKMANMTKLSSTRLKTPSALEVFIVEGDSAGGKVKTRRDANYQAVLPIRGKILNVQKATISKALANQEIATIFAALGITPGENYDSKQIKYHKIIIATDQDVDGKHIRTLLITLFMKYRPEIITDGYLYFLDTPLFVNKMKNKELHYTYDNDEQTVFLARNKNKIKEVKRNKGLGELDDQQVDDTILNAETRRLSRVTIEDAFEVMQLIDDLMGDRAIKRRQLFLGNNP